MVKKGIFVSFNHFFAAQNLTLNAYLLSKIWDFKIFLDFSLMSMCTRTLINKYLNSFWKSIANHFWQQTFILKLFVSKYKPLFSKDFFLTAQIPCDISTNAICVLGGRWLPRQSSVVFPSKSQKNLIYRENYIWQQSRVLSPHH